MKQKIKALSILALFGVSSLFAENSVVMAKNTADANKSEGVLGNVSLKANTDFESETVYRGSKRAQSSIQPNLEVSYPVMGAKAYAGVWSILPAGKTIHNNAKEVIPYVGASYEVTDMFTADAGFMYYWKANAGQSTFATHNMNRQREVYLGVSADVLLSPRFYVFYNFDLNQWVFQPSISYSYDLGEFGLNGFSLDAAANLGLLYAGNYNGNQRAGAAKHKNGYVFWAAKLDVTYHLNENASISAGPRYSGNNDGKSNPGSYNANIMGNRGHMFWWGANVNVKF